MHTRKKNAQDQKTVLALNEANREIDRLRRVSSGARSDHASAMETLTWALGVARALVIGHAQDAQDLAKKQDAVIFSHYDREAKSAFERAGLAPKFLKHALRDLKDHVASIDEAELRQPPSRFFEAFAEAYLRKYPELARARLRKARAR
ncbi:MAG: hypothetical protein KIS78_07900 [Labilithrix sp.]|nr:hypothetical protein [Labilithrix sp.]